MIEKENENENGENWMRGRLTGEMMVRWRLAVGMVERRWEGPRGLVVGPLLPL